MTLKSAWAWGPYAKGMGQPDANQRQKYAILGIKRELDFLGYRGMNIESPVAGRGFDHAVRLFQADEGLLVDGLAGQKTCNALWRKRIADQEVPEGWLRAQIHWEGGDDPGARNPGEGTYSDGSYDRGMTQMNSKAKSSVSDDQAWDPAFAIAWLGDHQKTEAKGFRGCAYPDRFALAVGSWRSPVGAKELCSAPETLPFNGEGATWGERVAYYISKVDTIGRLGWWG